MKRTDLLDCRGFFCAEAKSGAREGSLGRVRVGAEGEVVVDVLEGENCEVRSESWDLRRGSCEVMELRSR